MEEFSVTMLTWYRAVIPVNPNIINTNFQRSVGDYIYSISLSFYTASSHAVRSIYMNTRFAW